MLDINTFLSNIIALHDSGGDPNKLMQTLYNQSPQASQLSMQYNNLAQGKSKSEVILQLAKQGGASEQNIRGLARILKVNQ